MSFEHTTQIYLEMYKQAQKNSSIPVREEINWSKGCI